MANPRIMLAAPKSGSGKTLITCALLGALSARGLKVQAFKCGPDYIDPMFHQKVIGIPSRNLDMFFTDEEETKALFLEENQSDVSVIEGVMGLYDGLAGTNWEASSHHLATTLKTPVILVINARGMGRSLLAEINGFLSMDPQGWIKGVILNQVSEGFYQSMAPLIRKECGVAVLGYFPTKKELDWESRYLGLKLPNEVLELREKVTQAAKLIEETVDVDGVLRIAREADQENPLTAKEFPWLKGNGGERVRIGVAMDEAFCFYYEDNFRLLRNAGAELVPFSPLRDEKLPPDVHGLILGGGYPELRAKELSENVKLRQAISEAIKAGVPSLAECGGFTYLHETMEDQDGVSYPMVGAVPGGCRNTGKLVRFGYAMFQMPKPFGEGASEARIRGHEFHYYDSDAPGEDCLAVKPVTNKSWKCGYFGEGSYWSYGHLYYPSAPDFVKWFVGHCKAHREKKA